MDAPRFTILAVERGEWPFLLRMPFRFGVITVRDGRQAVLRVRIRTEDGREGWGVSAETLAAKWFDLGALRQSIQRPCGRLRG